MVNNVQEVMTSLQFEIDQSLTNIDFKRTISKKRFILEQAASEMLHATNLKKLRSGSKRYITDSSR